MRKWIGFVGALIALNACSSVDGEVSEDTFVEEQQTLDACDYTQCGEWHIAAGAKPSQVSCMVNALAEGRAAHASVGDGADGAACGSRAEVYVHASGEAFLLEKSDSECDSETDFDTWTVKRCTVRATAELEACAQRIEDADPDLIGGIVPCSSPDNWLMDCVPVEATSC